MACPSRDDLVGYALGALQADEQRSLEAHLPGCERCARELRALAPAVAALGESVEQLEPPTELRDRVMEMVRAEAARPERSPGRRLSSFLLRPAAGLTALALAGAGVAGYLVRDAGEDGTETVPVSAGSGVIGGSLEVSDDSALLAVHGMPRLAKGAVYQVWVADGDEVRPSSSFVPDRTGAATAELPEQLTGGDRVMVTREPGPGRTEPSSPPLLSARIG
jgi:anti-sigma-K factor RskA